MKPAFLALGLDLVGLVRGLCKTLVGLLASGLWWGLDGVFPGRGGALGFLVSWARVLSTYWFYLMVGVEGLSFIGYEGVFWCLVGLSSCFSGRG